MAGKKMEFEPEERQIVELLTKLKNQGENYPRKLLASRRQIFLSQMASVGLGLGIGKGVKVVAKPPKSGTLSHLLGISTSSVVETVLVLAIVVQASVIAYTYRDKLVDLINTLSSSSSLSIPTDAHIPLTGSSPTEVVVSDTPTLTITETPTASPSSTVTTLPPTSEIDSGSGASSNNTTVPAVTPQPTHGNNGNHYGQTPKPPKQKDDPKPTKGGGNGKKQ